MIVPKRLRAWRPVAFGWGALSLRRHTQAYRETCVSLTSFYALLFCMAVVALLHRHMFLRRPVMDPVWPVEWIPMLPQPSLGIEFVLIGFVCAAFTALFKWKRRWARLLVALFVLLFVAMYNSYGKVSHFFHGWVLCALLFIGLPDHGPDADAPRGVRHQTLLIFWGAQALFLLTYSMSGLGKILAAYEQFGLTRLGEYLLKALPVHTANLHIKYGLHLPFGAWLVEHPYAAGLLMAFTIYLEIFSLWVAFRPDLQRLWAILLVGMHASIYLAMNINFGWAAVLLLVLFWRSPFRSRNARLCAAWRQVPLFGWGARWWPRTR